MKQKAAGHAAMPADDFQQFVDCWNEGRFFDAHETLEPRWIANQDRGLRGLIQLAAAFHHLQNANVKGARTLLQRVVALLEDPASAQCPIDQAKLARFARSALAALDASPPDDIVRQRPHLTLQRS